MPAGVPTINQSYNKIIAADDYGTVDDWLKLNKMNITQDQFRENPKYQSAYKNWASGLQAKKDLAEKKLQMYYKTK